MQHHVNFFSYPSRLAVVALIAVLACFSQSSQAEPLNIFSCETEWAALSQYLAGEHASVYAATTPLQDPHHIQARPSLIAKIRTSDLVVCTGAELETGWLPLLLRKASNPQLQNTSQRLFLAAQYVKLLDPIGQVDRSMGHVHAAGNPHVQVDPRRMLIIAKNLSARLAEIDPAHADHYAQRLSDFKQAITDFLARNSERIAQLSDTQLIVHHNSWAYLNQWLGINQLATLEPLPGSPPTSSHLAKILKQESTAQAIVLSPFENPKAARWLSAKIDAPVVVLPLSPANWEQDTAIFVWYQGLIDALHMGLTNGA